MLGMWTGNQSFISQVPVCGSSESKDINNRPEKELPEHGWPSAYGSDSELLKFSGNLVSSRICGLSSALPVFMGW